MKNDLPWIGLLVVIAVCTITRRCGSEPSWLAPDVQTDTVTIYDTVRPPVPPPKVVTIIRRDTVYVAAVPAVVDSTGTATDSVKVEIPIIKQVYETEDYRAVVEGFRPRLTEIELYRRNAVVTNTVTVKRSPRWAITAGPGVGYGANGVQPYVGVTVGFVIWSK